ncbi:MAG: YebC/PmpR family DNA-binding transcriptional regulator [Tissierellales bacterium]|jgi:YebC/PmpR family DNA-binding regulatory protein|nr:YebC/PmpR family DNA-binding transcriptional regulator [Tissierellales bacterium]HCX04098.1 YebC/PmpR family DNA-binding transcriptional regulator [Clostridiales bacterium]
MAGHSKWANRKHRKGRQDEKRAKIFTKLARAITVAVREGGDDPEYNSALVNAIEKAKSENMPNDNIDRAIKKGTGDLGGNDFERITYEGYGPGGTAFIVNCLTDNKNRTAADIRHYFSKYDGNLGATGCVSYLFDKVGLIVIEKEGIDEEELMLEAVEAGAEDFKQEEEVFEIVTKVEDFNKVKTALKENYKLLESDLTMIPKTTVKIDDEGMYKRLTTLIDVMEDNDDVQDIYHNCQFEIDEEDN